MDGDTPGISITPPEAPGFPLTKEFLEIAFQKEVDTFTAKLGTNPGDNYMSIIHAIEVTFKGEVEENHYLIKCYPNHPGRREFLDQINVFEKELFMYDDFLKQLQQLVVEKQVEDKISLSLAPYHGGNVVGSDITKPFKDGVWSKENFIILTDIRKIGYKMVDRTAGLDIAHAALALREIARLHATSWAYKQKFGLHFLSSKYSGFADQMYTNKDMIDSFKPVMDNLCDNVVKVVKEGLGADHPACKSLRDMLSTDIMALLKECVQAQGIDEEKQESYLRIKPKEDKNYEKEPWLVCAHGDCWVNNMLFRYDDQDSTKPISVTLVDFQICREACPTTDLAYFLFNSVRAPIRIAHESELLRIYFDAFTRYCEVLEVRVLPGFTFENLVRRYRRSKIFGLLLSLPLLTVVLKPPEEAIDMDKDEGADISELFSTVMEGAEKNNKFRDEMTSSVLNLYEEGVL